MRLSLAACVAAGLAAAPYAQSVAQAQTRWDLPSAYAAKNTHTELLRQFAQDVATRSQGRLTITVHENAALYRAPEIKRAVQGGQVQIGEILLSNYVNEDALFELDSLPGLATGYAAAWQLYQAQKPYLQARLNAQGMQLLYSIPWPAQGIYTNRDLNTLADLQGAKWRAYNPATARIAALVGAQPVTIQAAELSQAMATGVVDSLMTARSIGLDNKIYEHLKKLYDATDWAWILRNAVIVNQRAFAALDAASQSALLAAAADIEVRGWLLTQARSASDTAELAARGMTVMAPAPELLAGLQHVGTVMLDEWLKKAGADGQALIDAYRQQAVQKN